MAERKSPALWLIQITAFVTACAAFTEWCWAILFCVEATGGFRWHVDWAAGDASKWDWGAGFAANLPVLFALLTATVPIVLWSMIWLPMYQQARGAGIGRRATMMIAGLLANALVILSGTIVMNSNRQDHVREGLVVEQSAAQGVAAIDARLTVAKTELARMTDPANTTNEARAARAGVTGWKTYVAQAKTDPSVPSADRQRIERAMGSAQAADAVRARIETLTVAQAEAKPVAATQAVVQDHYGAAMNDFSQYAQVYRPPFVALICTLIGIWGAWWLVGLWERYAEREAAPPLAIEDHSAEEKLEVDPAGLRGAEKREQLYDEDGNRIVRRRATFARVPTKKSGRRGDKTEYEAPAAVTASDPRVTGVSLAPGDVEANLADAETEDFASEGMAKIASGLAGEVRPRDETPPVSSKGSDHSSQVETQNDAGTGSVMAGDQVPDHAAAEAEPVVLSDDRYDELEQRGVIVDGQFVSQEHQTVIEQDDRAERYPALPAPKETEAA